MITQPQRWAAAFWLRADDTPPDVPISAWDGAPTTAVAISQLDITRVNPNGPVLVLLWHGRLFLRSGYAKVQRAKQGGAVTVVAKVLTR